MTNLSSRAPEESPRRKFIDRTTLVLYVRGSREHTRRTIRRRRRRRRLWLLIKIAAPASRKRRRIKKRGRELFVERIFKKVIFVRQKRWYFSRKPTRRCAFTIIIESGQWLIKNLRRLADAFCFINSFW